ncbi:hypothetical protein DV736_g3358, partial [Chaetothyriales sp. CBS 134916]
MSSAEKKADATSRHTLLLDTDTESDGNCPQKHAQRLTQEEKNHNAILMSIADLGSARRSEITAVDKGDLHPVNIVKLLQGRDCQVPGSDAGKLAAVNKSQLASWANFGNTDIARSSANEELDDIGNGQSHRQAMAERLLYTGVLTLEDSYNDRPRHKPVPALLSRPASKAGGGAASAGFGGSGSTDLSTKGYRPLDPAVVAGEKDSRYGRSGFQPTAKSKSNGQSKPNVCLDDSTVRVTRASTGGRVFQKRSWPPKGLEYLIPAPRLADPRSFMGAVTKALPALKAPCPNVASMTIRGVSLAVKAAKDERPIAKACGHEFRAPNISPDGLTEGKPCPQMLISPGLESECTEKMSALVGLGIAGVETKSASLLITQAAKEAQLDVGRIRNFVEKKETDALMEYLEQVLDIKSADPMQESVLPTVLPNPFKSKEPNSTAKADSGAASSKTHSSQAPSSTTESRSLTESIWAPIGSKAQSTTGRAPLKADPSKGNVSEAFKPHTATIFGADGMKMGQARRSTIESESTAIFGDVTALCRLPGMEPVASKGTKGVKSVKTEGAKTGKSKIKRTTAGPGYEVLVREMEQANQEREMAVAKKAREMEVAKKETMAGKGPVTKPGTKTSQSPVTQALKYANSVSKGLDFSGGGVSTWCRGGDDSDGSDDWEL